MKTFQIIENLKAKKGIEYDETFISLLLDFIALYPNGTKVVTNEGEIGVVIKQNSTFKERPILSIIKDKYGNNISEEKDLLKHLNVFIESVLE